MSHAPKEEGFVEVSRKHKNDVRRAKQSKPRDEYTKWAADVFPGMLDKHVSLCMSKFEQNQKGINGETEDSYQARYEEARQNVLRKKGTCQCPLDECLARSDHSQCEANRQLFYKMYKDEQKKEEQK
jgi:hypothetical protein